MPQMSLTSLMRLSSAGDGRRRDGDGEGLNDDLHRSIVGSEQGLELGGQFHELVATAVRGMG